MSSSPATSEPFALLVVDKPVDMTSHDVVARVRKLSQVRRIGHAGTLDPFASGVLVLCLGVATRLAEFLTGCEKRYLATLELGVETDTLDRDGTVTARRGVDVTREAVLSALTNLRGDIQQMPPLWSALRVAGERAHRLARRGEEFALAARMVSVRELELVEFDPPRLVLDVLCSAGTYVRSLARDLGTALRCGAHLSALRRTRAGAFALEDAVPLARVNEAAAAKRFPELLVPPERGLADWPSVTVDAAGAARVHHGHAVAIVAPDLRFVPDANCRIHASDGRLIAVGKVTTGGDSVQPRKVLE